MPAQGDWIPLRVATQVKGLLARAAVALYTSTRVLGVTRAKRTGGKHGPYMLHLDPPGSVPTAYDYVVLAAPCPAAQHAREMPSLAAAQAAAHRSRNPPAS